jgi:hypothetical protein
VFIHGRSVIAAPLWTMRPPSATAHLLFSLGLNGAAAVCFRNRLVNGNFSINQRAAPSGPTVYEPGAFIRDRWKAGPMGCTAACVTAANGDTTLFIGKGSVRQVVEGALYLPEGGAYCLSWQGDAVGRAIVSEDSPVFDATPVITPNLAPGTNIVVEFSHNPGGPPVSLHLAQIEPGYTPTLFERRDDERTRCQRYFRRIANPPLRGVICAPNLAARCGMSLFPTMRAAPKVAMVDPLPVFDGTSISTAVVVEMEYSSVESVELDLTLSSDLAVGRPAICFVGANGLLDLDAEMDD